MDNKLQEYRGGLSLFREIEGVAKAMIASGYFPDKKLSQAIVKIMFGYYLDVNPLTSMSEVHIVQGKPQIGAGILSSKVKASRHALMYNYKILKHDKNECAIQFYEYEDGAWEKTNISGYSMEDAITAGLVKPGGGWVKNPRNMLFARAMSNGVKWYCPDVTTAGSVYTEGDDLSDTHNNMPVVEILNYKAGHEPMIDVDIETGEVTGEEKAKAIAEVGTKNEPAKNSEVPETVSTPAPEPEEVEPPKKKRMMTIRMVSKIEVMCNERWGKDALSKFKYWLQMNYPDAGEKVVTTFDGLRKVEAATGKRILEALVHEVKIDKMEQAARKNENTSD